MKSCLKRINAEDVRLDFIKACFFKIIGRRYFCYQLTKGN